MAISKETKIFFGLLAATGATYAALSLGKGSVCVEDNINLEKPIVQTPTPTIIWPTKTPEPLPTNTPTSASSNCLCPVNPFKVNDLCYGILAKGPGTQCLCPCPEEKK